MKTKGEILYTIYAEERFYNTQWHELDVLERNGWERIAKNFEEQTQENAPKKES